MATAFMGGMVRGVSTGISLFNAIENKKHRDRMFEYQEKRDSVRDQQWQAAHDERREQWQAAHDQRQSKIDFQQGSEIAARQHEQLRHALTDPGTGQLMSFTPESEEAWMNQHGGTLANMANFGYGIPGIHYHHNQKEGKSIVGFRRHEKGWVPMIRTKDGETHPLTENRSSDQDDMVVALPFAQIKNMVTDGGYANKQRAIAAAEQAINEQAATNGQKISEAEARLTALMQLGQEDPSIFDNLSPEDEKILDTAMAEEQGAGQSKPSLAAAGQSKPLPAAAEQPEPSVAAAEQSEPSVAAAEGISKMMEDVARQLSEAEADGLTSRAAGLRRALADLQTNFDRVTGRTKNEDPRGLGENTHAILQAHQEDMQFRNSLRIAGQRRLTEDEIAHRRRLHDNAKLSQQNQQATTEQAPEQQAPEQQAPEQQAPAPRNSLNPEQRAVVDARIKETEAELKQLQRANHDLQGMTPYQLANHFGIDLAKPDAAEKISNAARFGDPNMDASQFARLSRERQMEQLRMAQEERRIRADEARARTEQNRDRREQMQLHENIVSQASKALPSGKAGERNHEFVTPVRQVVEYYGAEVFAGRQSALTNAVTTAHRMGNPQLVGPLLTAVAVGVDAEPFGKVVEGMQKSGQRLSNKDLEAFAHAVREVYPNGATERQMKALSSDWLKDRS